MAQVATDGIHLPGERPLLTPWTEGEPRQRALHVVQQRWRRRGTWTVDDWVLELGAFHRDPPVGMVALRGRAFPVLREVKAESWLGRGDHRQGFGTEARHALLHLAFEELDGVNALTEVFQDNAGSQGCSRALGYRADGISRDVRDGQVVVSDRLRLHRDDWQRSSHPSVTVFGIRPCLPFFGLRPLAVTV